MFLLDSPHLVLREILQKTVFFNKFLAARPHNARGEKALMPSLVHSGSPPLDALRLHAFGHDRISAFSPRAAFS